MVLFLFFFLSFPAALSATSLPRHLFRVRFNFPDLGVQLSYSFLPEGSLDRAVALIRATLATSPEYLKAMDDPTHVWGASAGALFLPSLETVVRREIQARLAMYSEPTRNSEAAEAVRNASAGPVLVLPIWGLEESLTIYAGGSAERALRHYHARRAEVGADDDEAVAAAAAVAAAVAAASTAAAATATSSAGKEATAAEAPKNVAIPMKHATAHHDRRSSWGGFAHLRDWVHAEMSRVARQRCEERGLNVAGRECRDLRAALCRSAPFRNTFPGYELFVVPESDPMYNEVKTANLLAAVAEAKASGCVETGTFRGDTTARLANSAGCPRGVVTVELNTEYASDARARFAGDPRVLVLEGDSATAMAKEEEVFHRLREGNQGDGCGYGVGGGGGGNSCPLFWFLDGHYSFSYDDKLSHKTARGENDSPIIGELDFVLRRLPALRRARQRKATLASTAMVGTAVLAPAEAVGVLDDPSYFQDTILVDDA
jgi:hypothetical protein